MRVLNLGAGVQSTTIYLMMVDGDIPPADIAIFADTQDEPREVYEHLERLKSIGGPEIVTVTAGNLGDDLIAGLNSTGQEYVTIPAHFGDNEVRGGMGKRQCTKQYKIEPIEREIRRRLDCIGKSIPKGIEVTQVFGLSFDEPKRVGRVADRYRVRRGWKCEFPLFDEYMTRVDCVAYLSRRWPHPVSRSACVYCPYRDDSTWLQIKANPEEWNRAVEVDRAIREHATKAGRSKKDQMYLHRSCQPLELVQLNPQAPDKQTRINWSQMDCEGMCGV